jgi:hypothetical protein
MSNAPVFKEVLKFSPVRALAGKDTTLPPQAREVVKAVAPESRMSRADQAEAANVASAARARRSGGYRSLLAPSRMESGMKGVARTLGGG